MASASSSMMAVRTADSRPSLTARKNKGSVSISSLPASLSPSLFDERGSLLVDPDAYAQWAIDALFGEDEVQIGDKAAKEGRKEREEKGMQQGRGEGAKGAEALTSIPGRRERVEDVGKPSVLASALDITGGDLTFGGEEEGEEEDNFSIDDVFLEALGDELGRFQSHEMVRGVLEPNPVADSDSTKSDKFKNPKDDVSSVVRLRQSAREVDERLRVVELESIQDYVRESDNLLLVHAQIKECDGVLIGMEKMLGRFQSDLGSVSEEIKTLQERSMGMGVRLRNRKSAESRLSHLVDELALPPSLISAILEQEGDLCNSNNESFLAHLRSLNRRLHFASEDALARDSRALREEVMPELERLRIKAIVKCREYLLQRILSLRKPKTNVHIIQQSVLLKYKYLAVFLREHGRVVFNEVLGTYSDIMQKVLTLHLRTYISELQKLQLDIATRQDLIGCTEDFAKQQATQQLGIGIGLPPAFFRVKDLKKRSQVFALTDRASVLEDPENQPAIIPHIAEAQGQRFPFEALFRSLHKLLVDTATAEYLFCDEFFEDESTFYTIFEGPLQVVEEYLTSVLSTCHDAIGLMLMIRIVQQNQELMAKRKVPCLDSYFDKVSMLIWPRFKIVFDLHLQSVRKLVSPSPSASPSLSLSSFSHSSRALFEGDVRPHFVTRRYAEFSAALLKLALQQQRSSSDKRRQEEKEEQEQEEREEEWNKKTKMTMQQQRGVAAPATSEVQDETDDGMVMTMRGESSLSASLGAAAVDGQLEMNLEKLRVALDHLLVDLSRHFASQKQRTVFLINNYDLVLSVFKEAGLPRYGPIACAFEELLKTFTAIYVEEELKEHFSGMLGFVRTRAGIGMGEDSSFVSSSSVSYSSNSPQASSRRSSFSSSPSSPSISASDIEPHLKEFAAKWKSTIEHMHRDVITRFSNFVCGMDVLRAVLTQLLLYYTRLADCLKRVEGGSSLMKEVVSIPSIMYEIRKYSLTF